MTEQSLRSPSDQSGAGAGPPGRPAGRQRRRSLLVWMLRGAGWLLITAGALILLYLVYALFFTNLATESAQSDLGQDWARQVGELETDDPLVGQANPEPTGEDRAGSDAAAEDAQREDRAEPVEEPPLNPGTAVAVLQFARPGSDQRPVHDEPLYVVEGVTVDALARGPGHYPLSGRPGKEGNFAVAGHRTTYGAPFFHLDQLRSGDEVLITDRDGNHWRYRVRRQRVVAPTVRWPLEEDPLGTGKPTLTLTTCNPRFSDRERLIVFAELQR